jgi:penicillin-binding protein 1A
MQVARNTFLADRATGARSIGRKLLELRVARLLENSLSKDEILELYLNAIYLGNGVYGVEGASRDPLRQARERPQRGRGRDAGGAAQGPVGVYAAAESRSRARAPQPGAHADARAGIPH